jgi:hypothetical protein
MRDFPEPDWKTLRALQPILLDRLCTRILDEMRGVMDDAGQTPHQRYLKIFDLLQDRNDDVAAGFDDMRRSRAIERLAYIHALGLFTDDEFQRFSPGTRETVLFMRGLVR